MAMTKNQIIKQFFEFLQAANSPFHAVDYLKNELIQNGFAELKENDSWTLDKKGRYFVVRGGTSLIAFCLDGKDPLDSGFKMVGAHTDSPCLKVKNKPERFVNGYLSLGVEPYGGIILSSWFDRDLSIAGNISYLDEKGKLNSKLIDFKRAVGVLPNLAIHLNPKVNDSASINKQTDLPVLIMQADKNKKISFRELISSEIGFSKKETMKEILDFDLNFYDVQGPSLIGMNKEFVVSQRLDNLLSCFVGLKALLEKKKPNPALLILNDHEEVGSNSLSGAAGTFLTSILERICPSREAYRRTLANSLLVSVDNAHGVHPNFPAKHEDNHRPILNQGPVIKINANQRYATSGATSSLFRAICRKAKVPVQSFINRSDLGCGTTIGPISSTTVGVETLDIGVATFAMHSLRETCGAEDIWYLFKALKSLFETRKEE